MVLGDEAIKLLKPYIVLQKQRLNSPWRNEAHRAKPLKVYLLREHGGEILMLASGGG